MPADKWIGFLHTNGKAYVCPIMAILDVVNNGEAMQLIVTGLEAYQVAQAMKDLGHNPEMRYVHAHIAGKSRPGRKSIPVVCNETGTVYDSLNQCARETGSTVGNISSHLRFPQIFHTVKGHTFSYYKGI
jgi:hypothetical protein